VSFLIVLWGKKKGKGEAACKRAAGRLGRAAVGRKKKNQLAACPEKREKGEFRPMFACLCGNAGGPRERNGSPLDLILDQDKGEKGTPGVLLFCLREKQATLTSLLAELEKKKKG